MNRALLVFLGIALVSSGCATQPGPNASQPTLTAAGQPSDLAIAGWRVPFECLELSQRIESSEGRLHDGAGGMFSVDRATDERRLRSLEARADSLGCLVPGSPHTY